MPKMSGILSRLAHRSGLISYKVLALFTGSLCLLLSDLASAPPASAQGSYSGPNYSGGQLTGNRALKPGTPSIPFTLSYAPVGGGYGGASVAQLPGSTAQCSGAITTTFTWSGSTSAPESTIIAETCKAGAIATVQNYAIYGDPTVAATDGMGDTGVVITTLVNSIVPIETKGTSVSHTRYTLKGGSTITLTCSPSVSASSPANRLGFNSSQATVNYTAAAYPVTISLAGVTTDTTNGNALKVLTGQQVTATLSDAGAPGTLSNFQWSTSGATAPNPFWTWDPSAPNSTNPTQFVPLNQTEMTGSSFSFYDEHNGDKVNVTCTATYTPPVGPPMQVTAQSLVITYVKPTTTWAVNQPYNNLVTGFSADYVHGDMSAGELWGPIIINEPALFTSGGVNTVGFGILVQIASLDRSVTRVPLNGQPATYSKIDVLYPNGTTGFLASPTGLDGSFPYYYGYYQNANGGYTLVNGEYGWLADNKGYSGDFPEQFFTLASVDNGGNAWDAATAADTFNTWVMYKPAPVPGQGTGSVYVPLQMLNWSWGGNANLVQLNATQSAWNATGTSDGGAPSNTDAYPTWGYEIPIGFSIGP